MYVDEISKVKSLQKHDLSCHYTKFGDSACTICISQDIQWYQNLRAVTYKSILSNLTDNSQVNNELQSAFSWQTIVQR